MTRFFGYFLGTVVLCVMAACGGAPSANTPLDITKLRSSARGSGDPEKTGRWLLDEMFAPGGTGKYAEEARAQLDRIKERNGLYASLGAAIYDEMHGEPKRAAGEYVATLVAARSSEDPAAPLTSWFASHHLVGLRGTVANLWDTEKARLMPIMDKPQHLGWRAVAELHEWSTAEALDKADVVGDAYDAMVTTRMGCARSMRIAGPFGRNTAPDRRRSFPAEQSPWPASWPEDPSRGTVPHVLTTERHRCLTASKEKTEDGVFYAETFFEVPAEKDLLVAVQGSLAVWVDDVLVSSRDLRDWGVWQKFGGAVRVSKGRHRVLGRVLNDAGSIRFLELDGTAAKLETDTDARKPYGLDRPVILPDPNPISQLVADVAAEKPIESSPLVTMLAAHAAPRLSA